MKLLLDECVVQDFRHRISGHDVYTRSRRPRLTANRWEWGGRGERP